MDVELSHVGGVRRTCVHHECPLSPYSLPYTAELPYPHSFDALTRAALLRAIRCCNHVGDYADEKRRIRLSLQLNRVPLDESVRVFDAFDGEFPVPRVLTGVSPQDAYDQYRTSVRQSAVARRRVKQEWKRRWQQESADQSTSPCKRLRQEPS